MVRRLLCLGAPGRKVAMRLRPALIGLTLLAAAMLFLAAIGGG